MYLGFKIHVVSICKDYQENKNSNNQKMNEALFLEVPKGR